MKGGKKMIPCIMAIIVGVFLLWIPSLFGRADRKVEQYGIPTVAQVMGYRPIEGGDVRIAVRFTDEYGVEHTGSSQQFGYRCHSKDKARFHLTTFLLVSPAIALAVDK